MERKIVLYSIINTQWLYRTVLQSVEEEVFEAVMRWFQHCPDERSAYVYDVMRFVRFWLIEEHYLYDRVLTSALLQANQQVVRMLDEVVHYKLLKDRWVEADLYMEPRYGSDFCRHVLHHFITICSLCLLTF